MSQQIIAKIKTMMIDVKRLDEEKQGILGAIKSLRKGLPKIYYIQMYRRHGFKEGIHRAGTCDEMYDYVEQTLSLDYHYSNHPERRKNKSAQIFPYGNIPGDLVTGYIKSCDELDYEWKEINAILEEQVKLSSSD